MLLCVAMRPCAQIDSYLFECFLVTFSDVERFWHPCSNDLGGLRHLQNEQQQTAGVGERALDVSA